MDGLLLSLVAIEKVLREVRKGNLDEQRSEKVTIQKRRIYMQNDRGSGLLVKPTGCGLRLSLNSTRRRVVKITH